MRLLAITILVFVVSAGNAGTDCKPICTTCHVKDEVCK
jgi:hypothetical protein